MLRVPLNSQRNEKQRCAEGRCFSTLPILTVACIIALQLYIIPFFTFIVTAGKQTLERLSIGRRRIWIISIRSCIDMFGSPPLHTNRHVQTRTMTTSPTNISALRPEILLNYPHGNHSRPTTVTARSKARNVFARTLWSWVRIPLKAWMCVRLLCVCVVLCVGSGLATDLSPVHGVLLPVYWIKKLKERQRRNKGL
jgi:hypothetical protein